MFSHGNNLLFFFLLRVCPIFQISNVTGENLDLLKMFLNLLSIRAHFKKDEPSEFQIDDTYSVPVGGSFVFILHRTPARSERTRVCKRVQTGRIVFNSFNSCANLLCI